MRRLTVKSRSDLATHIFILNYIPDQPVIFWHVLGGVTKDVANDTHGRLRRVDEGVTNHEFLEDVVLDRSLEHGLGCPLLLGCSNVPTPDTD